MRILQTQLLRQWDLQFLDSCYSELKGLNILADISLSKSTA